MKKILLMMCAVGLLAIASFAQKAANYSGTWKLDKERSKSEQRMALPDTTWTVTHSAKELRLISEVKRPEPQMMRAPENAPPGMGNTPAGGPPPMRPPGGRGLGLGGDGTFAYPLDGKESIVEMEGPMGKMPVAYKGTAAADGSLVLSNSRTFMGPSGEVKLVTKETWRLSADGKTLTVNRENTTPRGAQTSTLVFVKS